MKPSQCYAIIIYITMYLLYMYSTMYVDICAILCYALIKSDRIHLGLHKVKLLIFSVFLMNIPLLENENDDQWLSILCLIIGS